jgi:hypothetical protein
VQKALNVGLSPCSLRQKAVMVKRLKSLIIFENNDLWLGMRYGMPNALVKVLHLGSCCHLNLCRWD